MHVFVYLYIIDTHIFYFQYMCFIHFQLESFLCLVASQICFIIHTRAFYFTLTILLSKVFTWKASKCWLFSLFKFTYILILYFCRGSTSSASSCKRTGRPTVHCRRNRWTPRGNGCVNCHCIVVADSIFPVDALTTS